MQNEEKDQLLFFARIISKEDIDVFMNKERILIAKLKLEEDSFVHSEQLLENLKNIEVRFSLVSLCYCVDGTKTESNFTRDTVHSRNDARCERKIHLTP